MPLDLPDLLSPPVNLCLGWLSVSFWANVNTGNGRIKVQQVEGYSEVVIGLQFCYKLHD